MKVTKTKLYMAGISISMALALAACGENSSVDTDSQIKSTIETRGTGVEAPFEPIEISIDHESANIGFKFPLEQSDDDFDGFYLHAWEVNSTFTEADIPNVEDWASEVHPKFASLDIKENTFKGTGAASAWDHNLTIKGLKPETQYVLLPTSYMNYILPGASYAKRDLFVQSAILVKSEKAPIPVPCLEVTAFSQDLETILECAPNTRCVPTTIKTYGAHPTWCFDKDEQGAPVWDGAELSRQTWDPIAEEWGVLTELQPHNPTDDIFDTERDFRDCGDDTEDIVEFGKYKYTLTAYKGEGVDRVSSTATAEIVIPVDAPELDCYCCDK